MKKRITAFILIAVMAVTCCVLATGCGREKAEEPARGDENTITILISIDYPKKSGKPTLKNIKFVPHQRRQRQDRRFRHCCEGRRLPDLGL